MTYSPVEWATNGILYAMCFTAMNTTLTYRFNKWMIFACQMVLFFVSMYTTDLFAFMSVLRMIQGPIHFGIFALIFYTDKWPRKLFVAFMLVVVIITSEMIGAMSFYTPALLAGNLAQQPIREQILVNIPFLLIAAVLLWLLVLFLNRAKYQLNARRWLAFTFFPLSQYLLMFGWLEQIRKAGGAATVFFLLVLLLSVAADVILFYAIFCMSHEKWLRAENELLAAQIEAQKAHYTAITAQYEGIRRMRHDIAKHYDAMRELLESGRSEEATVYAAELGVLPYDTTLGLCEHPVVDAFFHSRVETARVQGVEIQAKLSVPADLPVANTDLISAFGNLMDNALEACEGVENARVSVVSWLERGCFIIRMENPVKWKDREKKRRIPGLERGVGLRILKELAEKYDGCLDCMAENGLFRANLIFRLGADHE